MGRIHYATINEQYSGASEKTTQFHRRVNGQMLTVEQNGVMKKSFKYYTQVPTTETKYDKFVAVGYSDDEAYMLSRAAEDMKEYLPDGSTSFNKTTATEAIDRISAGITTKGMMLPGNGRRNLTNAQKAALWQMTNKSWKPGNNPYDVNVGTEIYNKMHAE